MADVDGADRSEVKSEDGVVEGLSRSLEEWRTRIDELLVHIDLAGHEVRDGLSKQVELIENIYLAARSQLPDVRRDATANVKSLCEGTEKLVQDLAEVYQAAEAALSRSHAK
ncbi:MAG TPA: hypothetical protein VNC61_02840 [Acidimicrobiales bacterium]|nr:hypothetical protein [Acidimicrobiales bacterium]